MNKQLILKYKKEFDHHLNGGKVLVRNSLGEWCSARLEMWECREEGPVVVDDEYVEFRKALSEGKPVQCCLLSDPGMQSETELAINREFQWKNIEESHFAKGYATSHYRIKPEFEVGDWVRHPQSNTIYRITPTNLVHGTEHFESWEPQTNEWCWFWKQGFVPWIGKFIAIDGEEYCSYYEEEFVRNYSTHCEPFMGELPSIIKDTK